MKNLSQLHEEFIDNARRPMSLGKLPVQPSEERPVIIPVNKWITTKNPARMKKVYKFLEQNQRNDFVRDLLDYEDEAGHNAVITVEKDEVTLLLYTKDVDVITELDKEYAKYADELFRDVVYSPRHD